MSWGSARRVFALGAESDRIEPPIPENTAMTTTATTNTQIVKTAFEHFFTGDIPKLLELLSPEVEWDHRGPENIPFSRVYRGREEVGEFFKTIDETLENLKFDLHDFAASDSRVVALGEYSWRVKSTGKAWTSDFALVYTLADGVITHWKAVLDMTAASAAFE